MYGGQSYYPRSGDMWRVVAILAAGLVLVIVFAAVLFKDSELLNPSLHAAETDRLRAEADKLRAEAEAIRAQTADEQRQRELERRLAEAKAAVEEQALRDRRAVQSELLRLGGILGLVAGSGTMLALAFSYRLMVTAGASPKVPELVRKQHVYPNRASYDGFLAFCDDFFLSNGRCLPPNYDYGRPDGGRKYYPDGISSNVAQSYISILEENAILKPGANGCGERVIRRSINTLNDIKRRISQKTFKSLQAVGQKGAG